MSTTAENLRKSTMERAGKILYRMGETSSLNQLDYYADALDSLSLTLIANKNFDPRRENADVVDELRQDALTLLDSFGEYLVDENTVQAEFKVYAKAIKSFNRLVIVLNGGTVPSGF